MDAFLQVASPAVTDSSVIFTDLGKRFGDAMVFAGFDGTKYTIMSPCAALSIDFATGANAYTWGGTLMRTQAEAEKPLGNFTW